MIALQALDHGVDEGWPGIGVAEHAVVNAPMQGVEHGGRSGEVHVGDPQRQHVAAGIAAPFFARQAAAVDEAIEVEGGGGHGEASGER